MLTTIGKQVILKALSGTVTPLAGDVPARMSPLRMDFADGGVAVFGPAMADTWLTALRVSTDAGEVLTIPLPESKPVQVGQRVVVDIDASAVLDEP